MKKKQNVPPQAGKPGKSSHLSNVLFVLVLVLMIAAAWGYREYKANQPVETSTVSDSETERQLAANAAYLEKVKAQDSSIVEMPAGVLYKVLKKGEGKTPEPTSSVTVNYEGRTIDGHVFDSSYERHQPASFRLDQVIKGWTVALCSMPVGSTWEIYVPSDLAYGSQGSNGIAPNSVLIFKVELISIDN